jgi:hypothetical protein
MTAIAETKTYAALVRDIGKLYNHAHQALVASYWQIGHCIVEQEQEDQDNGMYTRQLIEQLSEDLSDQWGPGVSRRNLYKMRQFFLAHKSVPAPAQLSWSQHVELLPVTNKADRQRLARRIISDTLSPRQIRQEVRETQKDKTSLTQDKPPVILPPPCREQTLQC